MDDFICKKKGYQTSMVDDFHDLCWLYWFIIIVWFWSVKTLYRGCHMKVLWENFLLTYRIVQMFGGGTLWQIPVCLLSIFMSWDIVKIWTVKFGKPSVICQIHKGFPPPKITLYGNWKSWPETWNYVVFTIVKLIQIQFKNKL